MGNYTAGNIYVFDTNGAVNKSKKCYLQKLAFWGSGGPGYAVFTVNGTAFCRIQLIGAETNGEGIKEVDFSPPLYIKGLSCSLVYTGTAWAYLA